jgi:hypothetical protein
MSSLRTILFLLVPLSGVAMWRGWWRETNPLITCIGGSVAGLAAFWLSLRIFALALPFNRAAWLAYFAVTLAGCISALRWRSAEAWLTQDHPLTLKLLIAFAFCFSLSVYAASGALFSFDETMTHHLPLTASMQRGNLPPLDLREPPHVLAYHWGQHLLAAGISSITGCRPWQAMFGVNSWLAGCAFLLAYAFARREVSAFAAACGALLLVAGGTLNWLSAWRFDAPFATLMNPLGQPFTTGNTIMGGFFWRLHTNSTTWPVCLLLMATDALWRGVKERAVSAFILAAVLLALVAPGSETMLCAAVAGWLAAAMMWWAARRAALPERTFGWFTLATVLALLLAPLMGGPLAAFFTSGDASHQAHVLFNRAHFGSVPSWNAAEWFADPPWLALWSWRFVQDAGPVPWLLLPVLGWTLWRTQPRLLTLSFVALAALTAATTLTLTHYPANTFRLVNHAVVLGALPVGAACATWAERRRATRFLLIGVLLILSAAWPLSFVGLYQRQGRHFPWPTYAASRQALDEAAINWLKNHSDFRDGLLPLPLERWDVLPSGQTHPLGSFVGGRADYAPRAQRAAEKLDRESLAAAGLRFVYVVRAALSPAAAARLTEAETQGWLQLRWQSPTAERAIYEVVK